MHVHWVDPEFLCSQEKSVKPSCIQWQLADGKILGNNVDDFEKPQKLESQSHLALASDLYHESDQWTQQHQLIRITTSDSDNEELSFVQNHHVSLIQGPAKQNM